MSGSDCEWFEEQIERPENLSESEEQRFSEHLRNCGIHRRHEVEAERTVATIARHIEWLDGRKRRRNYGIALIPALLSATLMVAYHESETTIVAHDNPETHPKWQSKGVTSEIVGLLLGDESRACLPTGNAGPACDWNPQQEELHVFCEDACDDAGAHLTVFSVDALGHELILESRSAVPENWQSDCPNGMCLLVGGRLKAPGGRFELYVVRSIREITQSVRLKISAGERVNGTTSTQFILSVETN